MYEKTGVMPNALARKPELYDWMREFLEAFWLLSGRRSVGMSANPISFESIVAYLQLMGSDDFQEFIELICLMDSAFLAALAKRKGD